MAISEGQPWGELRSTGGQTVITGRHPSGTDYEMLVENPPITLDFQDIVWPSKLMLPWAADAYDELVAKEGALITLTESGKPEINLSALAEKVLMENRLVYEVEEESFYLYREESDLCAETSKGEINNLVSEGIKAISDECGLPQLATKRTLLRSATTAVRGIDLAHFGLKTFSH